MTKKYLINEKTFLSFLEEKLELSKNSLINNSDLEKNEEWDSITIMSFVTLLDLEFNISVDADDLIKCKKPTDLYTLVNTLYKQV